MTSIKQPTNSYSPFHIIIHIILQIACNRRVQNTITQHRIYIYIFSLQHMATYKQQCIILDCIIVIKFKFVRIKLIISAICYFIVNNMHTSAHNTSNQKCFSSLAKLLDYECSYQSRESTREQFYQQLQRHKAKLRKDNHDLKRQIEHRKQQILAKTLARHIEKLKQLNQTNQQLRQKHRLIYQTKKPTILPEIETPKSPLQTPRSRRTGLNISNNNDNSFSKVNLQHKNSNVVGRKSLNNENIQNMRPKLYGRMSLKITQAPKRNQQLTQRKMVNSVYLGAGENGCNISTFSQTHSMRSSVKSRAVQTKFSENIFVKFISTLLQEQKSKQQQFNEIVREDHFYHRGHEQIYINSLEAQTQKTSKNIQKLEKVLQNYELEIKKMHLNLGSVTQMTKQLGKVKQNYLSMQQKCKNIEYLRIEVATKQKKLKQLKQLNKTQFFEPPSSIQMILRLFGIQEASLGDPLKCKHHIKKLVKGSFQKPSKKKQKIKQLLDTIREGRKKFRELMAVYQGRIKKLERKLVSLRIQESRTAQN